MPATVERRTSHVAPVHRTAFGIDRRTLSRIGACTIACCAAWLAILTFGRPYDFFDMKIYHGAVAWWAGGDELYSFVAPGTTLGFTYPPFAALTMLPMVGLPTAIAGWINVLGSIAALVVILAALLHPIANRRGWPLGLTVGIAVPVAVAIEPSRETLGYGQVNLLLFGLIMADMIGLRWRARADNKRNVTTTTDGSMRRFWFSGAWAGAGIGLATAIKLTPALFIVHLMITRQWRAALTAIGTAAGVSVATFVLAGQESMTYFTDVLWDTGRVGMPDMTANQSLAGLLARLYDSAETPGLLYLSFALLMLTVGLSRAANAHADGDELTAFTLVGLTTNVISPISWSHHLVFVIPAVLVLTDAALRRRSASRVLAQRTADQAGPGMTQLAGLRSPFWFPSLTGLRHLVAALGLYLLFLISPIWRYEHRLPEVSHYQDGLFGALMENSLAIALIVLVAALPWRPGAEPAFHSEQMAHLARRSRQADAARRLARR